MGVEGRHLIRSGLRKPYLLTQRTEVAGRNIVVAILNEMQILDQQIVAPGLVPEQLANLFQRLGLKLSALGKGSCALARSDVPFRPVGAAIGGGLLLHVNSPFQSQIPAFG